MLKIGLQIFAHKKGVGSTRNGRDSEAKRLGVKRADGQFASGQGPQAGLHRGDRSVIELLKKAANGWRLRLSFSHSAAGPRPASLPTLKRRCLLWQHPL